MMLDRRVYRTAEINALPEFQGRKIKLIKERKPRTLPSEPYLSCLITKRKLVELSQ